MPASEAKIRATEKWNTKTYDEIKIRISKGQRQAIKDFAEAHGYSVNAFILEAVAEKMERMEGTDQTAPAPRPRRRRGFTLDGQQFPTLEALQAHLAAQGVTVTDNVILNWISKSRLSRENLEKYPILEQIGTYEYEA